MPNSQILTPAIGLGICFCLIVGLIAVGIFLKRVLRGAIGGASPAPQLTTQPLLSNAELNFYRVLEIALPADMTLFVKVHFIDLLLFDSRAPGGQAMRNSCSQKHADFVITDSATMTPRVVIELDDRSHKRPSAQARDEVKNTLCKRAGLPLLRIPAANSYSVADLRQKIAELLRPPA